jgi:nitroreductase
MEFNQLIEKRRSLRSLAPVEITEAMIRELADSAKMAPSCYNNQPWRFVFAYDQEVLKQLYGAMAKGNEWTHQASLIVAVFSEAMMDCSNDELDYYLFDSGMASAFLMLKAKDLGLESHAIAGLDFAKAKQVLNIPEQMTLITLINIGKKADTINPTLSEAMAAVESQRPARKEFDEFAYINSYK